MLSSRASSSMSTKLPTRRAAGIRSVSRLVQRTANNAGSKRRSAAAGAIARSRIPIQSASTTLQQIRTQYSSLIDPGSANKGGGIAGSRVPWQAEENIDIQKVTQTAIVSCTIHGRLAKRIEVRVRLVRLYAVHFIDFLGPLATKTTPAPRPRRRLYVHAMFTFSHFLTHHK